MNIIFLDIDGVLNSEKWFLDNPHIMHPDDNIDKNAVQHLNKICKETDAKIVISSTWRLSRTVEKMKDVLKNHGFQGEILNFTPDIAKVDWIVRGNEIEKWICDWAWKFDCFSHDFKSYVIIDDDDDMLVSQLPHFFQTDFKTGLTEDIANKIIEFFNNKKLDKA